MKLSGSAEGPLWYKDAVIYETHVRAFYDANNDGIGDFAGLMQKLDYLQDLGITCLWLLPFFPSPMRDDGYDISDYTNVHPSYGTLDDFQNFLNAAHERNIQVLIEMVINHTSDQHAWFQRARKAPPGSPEREFYVWSESDQKYRDTRIIFTDIEKSNWTWDVEAKAYYWHRFFSHQPDLNFDNPLVLDEVFKVMRFWLDMGVDAMRLDAIPYLVEREGTNCENLAETHEVIRRIRREIDAQYGGRCLLAEANQWPSDVCKYFGDGDECHMAFHFPLMPRIFMALRLEDRHPITEIMGQTPAIPDVCQWGLFLRNHDELTLEMVTDEERDYMYLAYSSDPRMRLNLGIRRRLAPLMENNRRRVELLNSLLFSFPGTPFIYYGDEIGMGDNIYLGDRNGVRTPMQWSEDRNAGFSRANPSKLYSPVILDPVYGYETINVEAQQNDPSSMLSWMRNMIALRKLFKVFGRGSIDFLHPANRKVLAYLRRDDPEQILCVANLSRFAQPVELDLTTLAGMTPIEMLGYTEFPTIGRAPYPLTLGPYGFYWFELQPSAPPVQVRGIEEEEEWVPISVEHGVEDFWEGGCRQTLETQVLPQFLPSQSWFGGKARTIASVQIQDGALLREAPSPAALLLVEVTYAEGDQETYFVPLVIATGNGAAAWRESKPECILCRMSFGGEPAVLCDASTDEAVSQAILQAIQQGREFVTSKGVIRAYPTRLFSEVRGPEDTPLAAVRGSAEQTNTSILYGDRMILKLFRRLEWGPNPDLEIGRYLSEKMKFERIPKVAGAIEYERPGSPPATLGMLQALVSHQGGAWERTLEELTRYYEECVGRRLPARKWLGESRSLLDLAESQTPASVSEAIGLYLNSANILGRRTAELHLALAAATDDPAFAPQLLSLDDMERLATELREHASRVFEELKENLARLPDEIIDEASLVLGQRRRLLDRFRDLETTEVKAVKIRIHGDYDLGQVLCVNNDYFILDFGGEPERPLAERRSKYPALKDVAGMLRSFSYAAFGALLAYTARRPDDLDRLKSWATLWERWTSVEFLRAYLATAGDANFLPPEKASLRRLLEAFLLDKALYELRYELNNRPSWVRIPLSGILSLA
ncbi:MAG: maltose alpha-D-glucosyltransferase [Acidobacteria bacterium]|nr:maltose alpha-D-glucosyltransferase [Acidobacteriota bacterium]